LSGRFARPEGSACAIFTRVARKPPANKIKARQPNRAPVPPRAPPLVAFGRKVSCQMQPLPQWRARRCSSHPQRAGALEKAILGRENDTANQTPSARGETWRCFTPVHRAAAAVRQTTRNLGAAPPAIPQNHFAMKTISSAYGFGRITRGRSHIGVVPRRNRRQYKWGAHSRRSSGPMTMKTSRHRFHGPQTPRRRPSAIHDSGGIYRKITAARQIP